jgi:hypothetical protein
MTPTPMMPKQIAPETAALLYKGLAALAIAAFLIAAATIFPSFQPSTAANASPLLVKADRMASAYPSCAEQNWPNLNPSCLRSAETNKTVRQVRLITTDHL